MKHHYIRKNFFLESTQNQRCLNVEFDLGINVEKSTLNQRGYHDYRRRNIISIYINVESTLSVLWVNLSSILLLSVRESTTPLCMDYNNISVPYWFSWSYTIFNFLKLTIIDFILQLIIIPAVSFLFKFWHFKKKFFRNFHNFDNFLKIKCSISSSLWRLPA